MPNKAVKRGGKYRVVDANTGRVTRNASGTAVDGGGHSSQGRAQKQASAINISQAGKSKRK